MRGVTAIEDRALSALRFIKESPATVAAIEWLEKELAEVRSDIRVTCDRDILNRLIGEERTIYQILTNIGDAPHEAARRANGDSASESGPSGTGPSMGWEGV